MLKYYCIAILFLFGAQGYGQHAVLEEIHHTCAGTENGSISIQLQGNPGNYFWEDNYSQDLLRNGLASGVYSFIVIKEECQEKYEFEILDVTHITAVEIKMSQINNCTAELGVNVSVNGGEYIDVEGLETKWSKSNQFNVIPIAENVESIEIPLNETWDYKVEVIDIFKSNTGQGECNTINDGEDEMNILAQRCNKEEPLTHLDMRIIENPSSGSIAVEIENPKKETLELEISLRDLSGGVVHSQDMTVYPGENLQELQFSGSIPPGTYILEARNETVYQSELLIIIK